MYISLFWCGVFATIGVELAAIIIFAIVDTIKKNKKR